MLELRLLDPDGYTVPLGVATGPEEWAESTERRFLDVVATKHAATWADCGYQARDYRVHTTPLAS